MYNIWIEGYAATGESNTAQCLANGAPGDSFREAVIAWVASPAGAHWQNDFDADRLSFWGCRAFDNESEARRNYG